MSTSLTVTEAAGETCLVLTVCPNVAVKSEGKSNITAEFF